MLELHLGWGLLGLLFILTLHSIDENSKRIKPDNSNTDKFKEEFPEYFDTDGQFLEPLDIYD